MLSTKKGNISTNIYEDPYLGITNEEQLILREFQSR